MISSWVLGIIKPTSPMLLPWAFVFHLLGVLARNLVGVAYRS